MAFNLITFENQGRIWDGDMIIARWKVIAFSEYHRVSVRVGWEMNEKLFQFKFNSYEEAWKAGKENCISYWKERNLDFYLWCLEHEL